MTATVPALTPGDPTARTMEASEKAIEALRELERSELQGLRSEVRSLEKLIDEKFAGRDTALVAALAAQKAAVAEQNIANTKAADKAEASNTKQISALDEKVNDLKDRVNLITGRGVGHAQVVSYIAIGVSSLVGVLAIAARFAPGGLPMSPDAE